MFEINVKKDFYIQFKEKCCEQNVKPQNHVVNFKRIWDYQCEVKKLKARN